MTHVGIRYTFFCKIRRARFQPNNNLVHHLHIPILLLEYYFCLCFCLLLLHISLCLYFDSLRICTPRMGEWPVRVVDLTYTQTLYYWEHSILKSLFWSVCYFFVFIRWFYLLWWNGVYILLLLLLDLKWCFYMMCWKSL